MPTYPVTTADTARDLAEYSYHPASADQGQRYDENRAACIGLAHILRTNCPPSRDLSLALTKLKECLMWANSAIACTEPSSPMPPAK